MYLFYFIAAFALLFVGQTINKLPRDIITLREYYEERNMTEFYVHLAVMAGFWVVTGILIYFFIYPLVSLVFTGFCNIFGIINLSS